MTVYENYTQTNIKWLEQIPSHWKLEKMKYLFYVSKKENEDETPNVLSLTQKGIVERDISTNEGQLAQSYVGYNIIEKDDIVFNPMDLLSGYVSKSKFDGVISQAYTTVKPLKDLNISYYEKFFQNWYHYGTLWHLGKGVSYDNRWTLNNDTLLNIKLPVPPLEEQNKIVSFIDQKSVQIEKFIKDKTRFIQLLREQKEVVISEAVTKGLDNKVKFKDSQIDWLGDIPKHWEIKKLKYLFKIQKRIANSLGYDVLSITQQGIKLKDIESGEGQLSMDYSKYQLLYKGEFAMNHMDLLTGFVDLSKFDGVVSPDYRVFTINDETFCKKYFLYIFQMGYKNKIFFGLGQGVSQLGRWRFPAENFENFKIQIPPVEEQEQIAEYIENELNQIDKLIDKTTKEIELIKEYKTSLINEAVSGKIKVV